MTNTDRPSEALKTFAQTVCSFINLIHDPEIAPEERERELFRLTTQAVAHILPLLSGERSAPELGGCGEGEEQYAEIYQLMQNRFPGFGMYPALDLENETVPGQPDILTADLLDNLTELYCALHRGWIAHQQKKAPQSLSFWAEGFRYHWGRHALALLSQLYCQLYRDEGDLPGK